MKEFLQKIKYYLNVIKERWVAEMPSFWKKVLNLCLALGTAAAGIISVDKYFDLQNMYHVSPLIFTVSGYVLAICGGLGLGAKLTKI